MLAEVWHRTNALTRLSVAVAVGALTFWALRGQSLELRSVYAWDAGALVFLTFAYGMMRSASVDDVRRYAAKDDFSRTTSRVLLLAAASASLLAVGFALGKAQVKLGLPELALTFGAVLAVVTSWCVVHLVHALYYADLYYSAGGKGLEWPDENEPPDFLDFAYFAFNLGMTFQVADIAPTTRRMRRAILGHALFSYAYGTVIVALTINLIANLL